MTDAERERAAVVAWLRTALPWKYETRQTPHVIGALADRIEAGEHLRGGE